MELQIPCTGQELIDEINNLLIKDEELLSLINTKSQIKTGSYVGTGSVDSSLQWVGAVSIALPQTPKMLFVCNFETGWDDIDFGVYFGGSFFYLTSRYSDGRMGFGILTPMWDANTNSLRIDTAKAGTNRLNQAGMTYSYVAMY